MARIPGEELERLKAETSLERLVTAAGVELKKAGSDLVGCCPFHDDREPSLVVSPGKNIAPPGLALLGDGVRELLLVRRARMRRTRER